MLNFATMIANKNTAKKTAEVLLQIKAIKLSPNDPFTWASGWKSPIYCDNRIVLSYPPIRNYIREKMAKHIEKHYGKPDVIAGVATGAIGIGALVAEYLGLPFIYVRPEAKKHGRQNQIEGYIESGQNVAGGRNQVAAHLITEITGVLSEFERLGFSQNLQAAWAEADYLRDKSILVRADDGDYTGVASGIMEDGQLQIHVDGELRQLVTGDVTVRAN